jgi:formylglycine-generating enzyme required for sulfatase activity
LTTLLVADARGERRVPADRFPLSVGGPGADVVLPGAPPRPPAAWLGLSEGDLFVQAAGEGVTCNGVPVTASRWLRAGDVLRIGDGRLAVEEAAGGLGLRAGRVEPRPEPGPPIVEVAGAGDARPIRPLEFRPRGRRQAARRRLRLRVLPAIAAVLLLALLAGAFWVFSARRVVVTVKPAPDRMELRGGIAVRAPGGGFLLRPGAYALIAEKEGHRRLEAPLVVTGEREQAFAFVLERLPGLLRVDAGGVEGTEVIVDGGPARAPGDAIELAPGAHDVRVRAPRRQEFAAQIEIEGGGATQVLRADLAPLWSEVRFASNPAGATLLVDGERAGVTPLAVELMPGSHRIEMRLAGHRPYRDTIRVEANQPRDWPPVDLVLVEGRLVLASEPPGATVVVDGAFRGQTPLEVTVAPDRDHEVEVAKAGHDPAARRVRLGAGETREWTARLAAREGEVEIAASPADAEVWVDGERRGAAGEVLRLTAVPHQIELRREGFLPHRVTLTPRPGFPQSLRVTLEPAPADRPAAAAPVLTTSQGHRLVLVQGGRFQMGASRREPGRRANETLRDVELTRPFYLGTTEVTNAQFRAFRPDHASGLAGGHSLDLDGLPAVRVAWEDAARYCNWLGAQESLPPVYVEGPEGRLVPARPLGAGYRLPLEAEWEWTARYHDGPGPRKYPWGDSLPPPPGAGNFADASARGLLSPILDGYDDGHPVTAPVGAFPPNGLGVYNLGGNVAEWVHDVYGIPPSGGPAAIDPAGPEQGDLHVIRGSSWMQATISQLRLTFRDYGRTPRPDVGFRIARTAE